MLGSFPLIAGLGVLLLLLLVAAVLIPPKRKPAAEPVMSASAAAVPFWQPPPPVYRSHRDMEIEEDAALIASHYKQTARDAYTQAALARHRDRLVSEDTRESQFQAAIAAWANANTSTAGKQKA